MIRLGVLAVTVCLYSACDSLDLAPIDSYGTGNYWKRPEHVQAYMDGLHKNLRDKIFQHQYTFGESRGGTSIVGTAVDGTSLSYGELVTQQLTPQSSGVSKFGELYGMIANVNIFLQNTKDATYMTEDEKSYYLGQAYGLRAYYYFDLYRIYGTAPLRLDPNPVVNGNFNPEELYAGRASGSTLMGQIKSDLTESLKYFGDNNSFDPNNRGNKKGYWSKAATECLMGEVYLWISKVSTGDDSANESNLEIAKTHLQNVLSNYGLKMLDDFSSVFDAKNGKGNSEIIFAVRYAEGEATNNNNLFTYAMATGSTKDNYLANGEKFLDALNIANTGSQQLEYKHEIYNSFDVTDTRREATFIASYNKNVETNELTLRGTHVRKNIGYVNAQGSRIYCGDYIIYRLPLVYLMLAEIENMQGGNVAQYINIVRKRAYGTNWNEAIYGYKNSDYTINELAILHEKDKEFIQEGQRWWDIRRMTLTKGGKHLVFCKEGSIGTDTPTLDETTEAHKVLWPVDKTLLGNDPLIYQTPVYATYKKQE